MIGIDILVKNSRPWNKHTPGDPMPCSPTDRVDLIFRSGYIEPCTQAGAFLWTETPSHKGEIVLWKFSDPVVNLFPDSKLYKPNHGGYCNS